MQKRFSDWVSLIEVPTYTFPHVMPVFDRYFTGVVILLGMDAIWSIELKNKAKIYARTRTARFEFFNKCFLDNASFHFGGTLTSVECMTSWEVFHKMLTSQGDIIWVYEDDLIGWM